jgi:RNA polymerase sigma factor (TIGR02999 family)
VFLLTLPACTKREGAANSANGLVAIGATICAARRHGFDLPLRLCRDGGRANIETVMDSASQPGEITQLLAATRAGDPAAWNRLVHLIYADLNDLAHRLLRGRGRDRTLNTSALVHECYMRIMQRGAITPNDRNHFLSLAARVMRQVICDYARERLAEKRGGGVKPVTLDELDAREQHDIEQFVELDAALTDLAKRHERQARVVECRFFAGLTDAETAAALGISLRSVARDWEAARAWLSRGLAPT